MTFEQKVQRLRDSGLGEVTLTDYFPDARRPYRYAALETGYSSIADVDGQAWFRLAAEIEGYLAVHTHRGIRPSIAIDRPLSEEEIGDNPPRLSSREVTP